MANERFEPGPAGEGLVDHASGLIWEVRPGSTPLSWIEAARDDDWRLPTITELMTMLVGLTASHPSAPPAGCVLWSASESPFASVTLVRVVECGPGNRYAVMLRSRSGLAWAWRIRRNR